MNNCFENHESGIKTIAKKNIRCDTRVQFNTCKKNKQHGVHCVGENNFTVVTKNCELSANTCTGVCAQDKASIKITNNLIESNFAQGVLLVESTYAHIEKNILRKNYKAQIAFGGAASCDTIVLKNEITKGRAEGIFAIESGFAWIFKNHIT